MTLDPQVVNHKDISQGDDWQGKEEAEDSNKDIQEKEQNDTAR